MQELHRSRVPLSSAVISEFSADFRNEAMTAAAAGKDLGFAEAYGIYMNGYGRSRGSSVKLKSMVMDSYNNINPGQTTATIPTPIQFVQYWYKGIIYIISTVRNADKVLGITSNARPEDNEVIQRVVELMGNSHLYSDYQNVPNADYNPAYDTRTIVRFTEGMRVGYLEELQAARAGFNPSQEKRDAILLTLEQTRNAIALFGFNNGQGNTYGYFNDPGLFAAITLPSGTPWQGATFLQITSDLQYMYSLLVTQSGGNIDPMSQATKLVIPLQLQASLATPNDNGTQTVRGWINQNFPGTLIELLPEAAGSAPGGNNFIYLQGVSVADSSTDGGEVWQQEVPVKSLFLGTQQLISNYIEAYLMATAGAYAKRPFGVVRATQAPFTP